MKMGQLISKLVITVRDVGAYYSGTFFPDGHDVEIVDWQTSAHFQADTETGLMKLDDEIWGTFEALLKMDVCQFGIEDGKFTIYVA